MAPRISGEYMTIPAILMKLPVKSVSFPGNGNLQGRDNGGKTACHIQPVVSRDKASARNHANSGLSYETGKSLFVGDCVVGLGDSNF